MRWCSSSRRVATRIEAASAIAIEAAGAYIGDLPILELEPAADAVALRLDPAVSLDEQRLALLMVGGEGLRRPLRHAFDAAIVALEEAATAVESDRRAVRHSLAGDRGPRLDQLRPRGGSPSSSKIAAASFSSPGSSS